MMKVISIICRLIEGAEVYVLIIIAIVSLIK